jgi:uncharacterized protein (TIRG00374 family)
MKKRINVIISLLVGIAIFAFFLKRAGIGPVIDLFRNINLIYVALFITVSFFTFFSYALRWQIILKAYKKKVRFITLLRQTIAAFAVSYLTPAARLGGEPLRAYMLKKEAGVDLKTGTSSIIMDKFVELVGSILFAILGLCLFLFIPGITLTFKLVFTGLIVFTVSVLLIFYHRTVTGRGSFSSLFNLFRLYKIARWKNFVFVLKDIEKKLEYFFVHHKKAFFLSSASYLIYTVLILFEMKFLLLAFGVNASIMTIVISLTLIGACNFIPVPAALGFLEAGQTSLFAALQGEGSIGFALSLLLRMRHLFFVAVGFSLISHFSVKIFQKKKELKLKQEKVFKNPPKR